MYQNKEISKVNEGIYIVSSADDDNDDEIRRPKIQTNFPQNIIYSSKFVLQQKNVLSIEIMFSRLTIDRTVWTRTQPRWCLQRAIPFLSLYTFSYIYPHPRAHSARVNNNNTECSLYLDTGWNVNLITITRRRQRERWCVGNTYTRADKPVGNRLCLLKTFTQIKCLSTDTTRARQQQQQQLITIGCWRHV